MEKLAKKYEKKEKGRHVSYSEKRRRAKEEKKYVQKYGKGKRYIPPSVRRHLQAKAMGKGKRGRR